jgi:hypothetical protein
LSEKHARLAGFGLLAAGVALLGGCGLTEYEAKIELEQKRLEYVDAEASFLEGPVNFPEPGKDAPKDAVKSRDVFLRPPKGVGTKVAATPVKASPLLHEYPAARQNNAVRRVWVAVNRTMKEEDFKKQVLSTFGASGGFKATNAVNEAGRFTRKYDTLRQDNSAQQTTTEFNFYKDKSFNAAVVFEVALADGGNPNSAASQAIRYSLASLRLGREAAGELSAFRSAAPPTPAPKGAGK